MLQQVAVARRLNESGGGNGQEMRSTWVAWETKSSQVFA